MSQVVLSQNSTLTFSQDTHRFINGIRILFVPTLSFTTIQGHLDISKIQQVLGLVVILLGCTAAQWVERAVTGKWVLATQLEGVADTAARTDGVISTPAVVALDGVLGCQGAVAFDGVLWA